MSAAVQVVLRRGLVALGVALAVSGCSMFGGPDRPKPAELPANPATLGIRPAWTSRIGEVDRKSVV